MADKPYVSHPSAAGKNHYSGPAKANSHVTRSRHSGSAHETPPPNNHVLKKRLPPRFSTSGNDVYISNKTSFQAQLKKCEKLLEGADSEIVIHGLGAAIERAINLSLQLKEKFQETCELDVNTATVSLQDDLEPLTEDTDYDTQMRQNSAVHIRIYRKNLGAK